MFRSRGCWILCAIALSVGCDGSMTVDPDGGVPEEDGGMRDGGRRRDAGGSSDAGPEPCATMGAVEDVACGSCGTTTRFCTAAGYWAYGVCEGEGECAPGEERSATCGSCGTTVETCSEACAWEPSGVCEGEGACAPGTRSRSGEGCAAGETRDVVCTDACTYEPDGACAADDCAVPGMVESVPCGNCGTVERFCTAEGVWSYGTCSAEGECTPGTSEMRACGNCGQQLARCTTACAWEATAACENEGECAPGSTGRSTSGCPEGQSRELTCNASCIYEAGVCQIDQCTPGETTSIACGMCGTRVRTCDATRQWVDGPCTGEGVCMPGTTGTQNCGYCGSQPTRCDTTCNWIPSASCSGEGTCAAGSTSACSTTCGSVGSQTCSATCAPGVCVPPVELCNGRDDDCDGTSDEGCTGCTACAGSTSVAGTGGRYTVTLTPNARTGSCGGSGSEALLSLTLSATSDVFVSTHGAGIDTVLYARRCNCDGTELGCNDDADARTTSVLRLNGLAAGNYTIVVDSKSASSASIGVDVYVTPTGIAGDRCGNPRLISTGTTRLTGDSCTYTSNYERGVDTATCNVAPSTGADDGVYYFYLPTTSTVSVNGCGTANTYDGTVYIRSVCNGSALTQQVACDDDSCGSIFPTGGICETYRPRLTTTLGPGLYYLFVDGYTQAAGAECGSCGPFDLTISGI